MFIIETSQTSISSVDSEVVVHNFSPDSFRVVNLCDLSLYDLTLPHQRQNGKAGSTLGWCYGIYVFLVFTFPLTLSKYIPSGGTIVSTLAKSPNDFFEACNVSLLVRGADRARVFDQRLFKTVLFESLGDTAEIERIASNYDRMISF